MKNDKNLDLESLAQKIADFCKERDWEQFHNPKNLSMALAVEASELMEIFQWLTLEESVMENLSAAQIAAARDELADIIIYAIRASQMLDIDLLEAVAEKIGKNRKKYPANKFKGKAALDN